MDTSQRTQRGRRPALAAAVLAVCAFGSAPALAQLPVGPEVTVPLPIGDGNDGSSPVPTTTTPPPPSPSPPPSNAPTTSPAPAPTVAESTPSPVAADRSTDTPRRSTSPSRRASARPQPPVEETFDVAPAAAEEAPAIARLRQVTLPAARQFGFPLGLAALVLAFLAVQGRLDARDPKLAAAPLSVDDDLLPFT